MKTLTCFIATIFLSILVSYSQSKLVPDKQGTLKILSRTDYARDLTFSQTIMTANLEQLKNLIAIVQQNQVLAGMKGFNLQVRLDDISSMEKCPYGVPVNLEFEFLAFFLQGEKIVPRNTIEPPEWELQVNCMNGVGINSYYHTMNKCYFTIPFNKKTIAPGIDLYDNIDYVLYDPSRPDYWIPVTVNEAFAAAREFAAKETDEYTAALNKQFLDNEWNEIPAEYRDKPAYFGGGLSRVTYKSDYGGQKNLFPPIVKINPDYWNNNRPKSDIQFMVFEINNKEELKRQIDRTLKENNDFYPLYLFEYSLDLEFVKSLTKIINK